MRTELQKAMKNRETIFIMYMAKDHVITKRRVKVLKLSGDTFTAYCFTRRAKRTFRIQNVLAVAPIKQYERQVI